jgi:hypothetical protein
MEHRVPTIFEFAEQAARQQKKAKPQAGQRKLKPARKASGRTSRRPPATPRRKRASKRKS